MAECEAPNPFGKCAGCGKAEPYKADARSKWLCVPCILHGVFDGDAEMLQLQDCYLDRYDPRRGG